MVSSIPDSQCQHVICVKCFKYFKKFNSFLDHQDLEDCCNKCFVLLHPSEVDEDDFTIKCPYAYCGEEIYADMLHMHLDRVSIRHVRSVIPLEAAVKEAHCACNLTESEIEG